MKWFAQSVKSGRLAALVVALVVMSVVVTALLVTTQTSQARPNEKEPVKAWAANPIQQKLNQKMDVDFEEEAFGKFIDLVARKLEVRIEIDWKRFSEIGPDRSTKFTYPTRGLPIRIAIDQVLEQVATANFGTGAWVVRKDKIVFGWDYHLYKRPKQAKQTSQAASRQKAMLTGQLDQVSSLYFLPDGKTLASADGWENATVRLWDTVSGKQVSRFDTKCKYVKMILSPEGKTLAWHGDTYLNHKRVSTGGLWDVATGKTTRTFAKDDANVLCFSPDSKTVVTLSDAVRGWEVGTGKLQWAYRLDERLDQFDSVYRVNFTPDGKSLVLFIYEWDAETSYDIPALGLWDVATGKEKSRFKGFGYSSISGDGKTIASLGKGKTIHLRDLATGRIKHALYGTETDIACTVFSPDGKTLAMGDGYVIRLWDVATGRQIMRLDGHSLVYCLAFSPDGKTLASGGVKTIRLWNVWRKE